VVNEVDGAGLSVFVADPGRPHPGCVINRRELETSDLLSTFSLERQKLDVHLDMMARNLPVVTLGVHLAQPGATRQPVDAIALAHPGDRGIRYLDAVVARQTPGDPHGAEVVPAAKMEGPSPQSRSGSGWHATSGSVDGSPGRCQRACDRLHAIGRSHCGRAQDIDRPRRRDRSLQRAAEYQACARSRADPCS